MRIQKFPDTCGRGLSDLLQFPRSAVIPYLNGIKFMSLKLDCRKKKHGYHDKGFILLNQNQKSGKNLTCKVHISATDT